MGQSHAYSNEIGHEYIVFTIAAAEFIICDAYEQVLT